MATIEKYSNGAGETRYRVRYRTPDRRSTQKRGFKTKRDAEAFANTIEVKKLTGQYVSPSAGRVTVAELGPAWLERQKGHMKPSGYRSYESAWRVHIEPHWAGVRLGDIRFSDVQTWIARLAANRGPVIVQTAHSVLARIIDDAVRDRLLAANPARGVKLPHGPHARTSISLSSNSGSSQTRLAATSPRCSSSASAACGGARPRPCGLAMSISCAAASSYGRTPSKSTETSWWAPSSRARTARWRCRAS